MTERDVVFIGCLEGAGWHLEELLRDGHWHVLAASVHDTLGRYGMGRN